ncbi:MAG: argininosuccinate lyase, partial [Actinomycetia bacterium]|nr:argininosuccinate lyase [Actinomycetes bacterium]
MKLWGGRFEKEINKVADDFCKSIYFDIELAEYDIQVNLAYANALQKANILTGDELEQIKKALCEIKEEIENKEFKIIDSDEDIHTAIERAIVEKTGETGKKIHTGRSRNEQVAADERLYLKVQIKDIARIIKEVQKAIIDKSKENIDVLMPGYTHFQPAQPILFSHYLLAYFWALQRDIERLMDSKKRVDISPLGSGALSGNSLNIDRGFLAEKLGFNSITKNSIDAVSDRDFIFEFLSISSLILIHISRLAEEIIVWSNPNFDFIELDDSYTTGSSLMPQKKNPD